MDLWSILETMKTNTKKAPFFMMVLMLGFSSLALAEDGKHITLSYTEEGQTPPTTVPEQNDVSGKWNFSIEATAQNAVVDLLITDATNENVKFEASVIATSNSGSDWFAKVSIKLLEGEWLVTATDSTEERKIKLILADSE
jgi:hypothetical protein